MTIVSALLGLPIVQYCTLAGVEPAKAKKGIKKEGSFRNPLKVSIQLIVEVFKELIYDMFKHPAGLKRHTIIVKIMW